MIRRVALVTFAVGAALVSNLVRTTALVFIVARWGFSVFEAWHTPTGHALFVGGLILLSGLAFLFKRSPERRSQTEIPQDLHLKMRSLAPLASVTILLRLAAIVGGTELWYSSTEEKFQHTTLEVTWPIALPGYKETVVPENVRQVLLSSSGRMATWDDRL